MILLSIGWWKASPVRKQGDSKLSGPPRGAKGQHRCSATGSSCWTHQDPAPHTSQGVGTGLETGRVHLQCWCQRFQLYHRIKLSSCSITAVKKIQPRPVRWKLKSKVSQESQVQILNYKNKAGTSLVVQWLRRHIPNEGDLGSIPGQGIRSRMPQLRPCAAK